MLISSEQTETNPLAKNKKGWKYTPFAKTKKFSNSSIAKNNSSEKNPRYSIKKENYLSERKKENKPSPSYEEKNFWV